MFSAARLLLLTCITCSLSGCARYSKVSQRSVSAATVTAEQRELTHSLKQLKNQPLERLGLLLDAADAARRKLATNPNSAIARADYNFAVSRIAEIIGDHKLSPWDAPVVCRSATGAQWRMTAPLLDPRPELHPSRFQILPTDRYSFKGKLVGERSVKEGLGAPVVVVGKDQDFTKIDQFAQGKQIHYGLTALVDFDGSNCQYKLLDPLEIERVTLDGNTYPLGADFQAPTALALADLHLEKVEKSGFFRPSKSETRGRLARLQPYNPDKIPVLVVHGLGNSPATWAPLIDFLRADEDIREHYQFWFFAYPSGLPYPMVTATLRQQLEQIQARHPNHKDMVVIGHSMGGMISRLLITDSGTELWDTVFDLPPDEIPFQENTKKLMTDALIFEADGNVGRVIFVSASHRGAGMATNLLGKVGAKIIGDPIHEEDILREALAHARVSTRATKQHRLPNSVDILDPDSPFLKAVDAIPVRSDIPFHSIIGDRGKGGNLDRTEPASSDGIVPYWSSHMEGAQSEVVIPSGHWSHLHPLGMTEIKRILIKHLRLTGAL